MVGGNCHLHVDGAFVPIHWIDRAVPFQTQDQQLGHELGRLGSCNVVWCHENPS